MTIAQPLPIDVPTVVVCGATFSKDRVYRYALWRIWDDERPCLNVIGLNPSTADEAADDPTIRRCIALAKRLGLGGLFMTNIFGFRSTDPTKLRYQSDPIGPDNDVSLRRLARASDRVVCAWGVHGSLLDRQRQVLEGPLKGVKVECLGITKDGYPRHPLYLANATPLEPFTLPSRGDAS